MDITRNYAPFDTCASQRTTAHLLDQISHVEELGVKNPPPQQPESDGCIQNSLAQPTLRHKEIQSKSREEPIENLGIELRETLQVSLRATESTDLSVQSNETTNEKPASMEKVPLLALWLGELPIGLCDAGGPLMKQVEMLELTNEYPPEFILEVRQILELIRKERNRKAHDLPKTWQVHTEEWNAGIKDLERYDYISSAESDKMSIFYGLLRKSKLLLELQHPLSLTEITIFKT